jgi:hypothetical protein
MDSMIKKQNMGWGILLICAGISAIFEQYTEVSAWYQLAVFFVGGLVSLALFFGDRSNWLLLIPTYIMLFIAVIGAIAILDIIDGDLLGAFVLVLIAAPFLVIYLKNKNNWWAIIPSFILFAIALMLFLTSVNVLSDDLIGPFVLFSIAIPFLVVYFRNKENWWALIPAYTMIVIGIMVGLIETDILRSMLIPAYVFLAIAIPFFVVYFRNKDYWWALIPGGILGLVGFGFLLSESIGEFLLPAALIAAGLWMVLRKKTK